MTRQQRQFKEALHQLRRIHQQANRSTMVMKATSMIMKIPPCLGALNEPRTAHQIDAYDRPQQIKTHPGQVLLTTYAAHSPKVITRIGQSPGAKIDSRAVPTMPGFQAWTDLLVTYIGKQLTV